MQNTSHGAWHADVVKCYLFLFAYNISILHSVLYFLCVCMLMHACMHNHIIVVSYCFASS